MFWSFTPSESSTQIGENAFVYYRNAGGRVSYGESYRQSVGFAFEGAVLNETADAKRAIDRRFFGGNLSGAEEEHQVLTKGA
jgi:hypothetical protein